MSKLTDDGKQVVSDLAGRHGFGADAVTHALRAVWSGHGAQAQFNHPELGGMGQWSAGGMTLIGDMFNTSLKARVDSLCTELSDIVRNRILFETPATEASGQTQDGDGPGASVWPAELGQSASTGSQNGMRYAYFPAARRLAIESGGQITLYDTGDHRIGGFGQAQGGSQNLTFTSQHGQLTLSDLRRVADQPVSDRESLTAPKTPDTPAEQSPDAGPRSTVEDAPDMTGAAPTAIPKDANDDQIFSRIERLADLFDKGILSQSEFEAKKAELLARL